MSSLSLKVVPAADWLGPKYEEACRSVGLGTQVLSSFSLMIGWPFESSLYPNVSESVLNPAPVLGVLLDPTELSWLRSISSATTWTSSLARMMRVDLTVGCDGE